MTPSRAVSVSITGTVQGVSFRANAAEVARANNLTGWVMNRPDGSLDLVAEGTADDVETLVDWCHDGPSRAQVDDVEVRDIAPEGFGSFDIRR